MRAHPQRLANHANLCLLAIVATLVMTLRVEALDLKAEAGRRYRTIAHGDNLRTWDNNQMYGAETIAQRDRSRFNPLGIRVGNYLIFPSVKSRYVFDDNVFATATQTHADHIAQLIPTVLLRSQFGRHVLDFDFGARISRYARNTSLNTAEVYGSMDGALHIDHAHTLAFSLLSSYEAEDGLLNTQPNPAIERTRLRRDVAEIGLTRDAGRLHGSIGASYKAWTFDDVKARDGSRIPQSFRDLRIYSSDLKLGYRFSPGFSFETRLHGLRRLNRGNAILSNDAWGYEIITGVKFETSPLLKWDFAAGYGKRMYDQAGLPDTTSGLLSAGFTWIPTQKTTINGRITREIGEGVTVDSQSGTINTKAKLSLDYEIARNVIFTINGHYINSDFIGSQRNDRIASIGTKILYLPSRDWELSFEYEYVHRTSNESAYNMRRNRFMLTAKRQF